MHVNFRAAGAAATRHLSPAANARGQKAKEPPAIDRQAAWRESDWAVRHELALMCNPFLRGHRTGSVHTAELRLVIGRVPLLAARGP